MPTISKATIPEFGEQICQGDVFKNVKYSYIDSEDDESVDIIEFEFPYAIIISQACDVISMEKMIDSSTGKPSKFMPSILLCPIYNKDTAKKGDHIKEAFDTLKINFDAEDVYKSDDYKVSQRDWHYRFHSLTIEVENKEIIKDAVVDFKHYFSIPMTYLIKHKSDRILHIDNLFSEQLTLKFATYLSRVAIP